jgi:hypothetical protein
VPQQEGSGLWRGGEGLAMLGLATLGLDWQPISVRGKGRPRPASEAAGWHGLSGGWGSVFGRQRGL